MTHEFKNIVKQYSRATEQGIKSVLATVVALDGSSYRRPGVRMLILEDGSMTGAVSGGCVEKEVLRQAQSVFLDNKPKIMTYDGRYRLGCEGILYILLEPFNVEDNFIETFNLNIKNRKNFSIISYFSKTENDFAKMGSVIKYSDGENFPLSKDLDLNQTKDLEKFKQIMKPCFKLLIIGGEHDAVQLCTSASLLGWEVNIIASPKDPKTLIHFPGAEELLNISPEQLSLDGIDQETAIILMNHNYAYDLKFLIALKDSNPAYIGLLGPSKRREKILNEFLEFCPDLDDSLFDLIHGPAGLNIGAETPQEIAISILSEILTVIREKEPFPLKEKVGGIHN